jgi:phosphoserine phosphatase
MTKTAKLCVFDFDSTLMDGETINEIAAACGQKETFSAITERAMAGELDFFEALTARVELLAGIPYEEVLTICHQLPLMPGATETVHALKQLGYKVVVFSGGFRQATAFFGEKLGLDAEFANFLHHKNGLLTGKVGGEMMFNDSKGKMLQRLQQLLAITPENTVAVGDGANDASMFPFANKKVAFCAREILQKQANVVIQEKDLRLLLNYL